MQKKVRHKKHGKRIKKLRRLVSETMIGLADDIGKSKPPIKELKRMEKLLAGVTNFMDDLWAYGNKNNTDPSPYYIVVGD